MTVSVKVAVAVIDPEVPVMVRVVLPTAAELLATSVICPSEVIGFGVKVAVTPLGNPLTDNVTLPLKPLSDSISTKVDAVAP